MTGTNCRPLILTIPPTPLIQSTSLLLYSVYISYLVCISRQKKAACRGKGEVKFVNSKKGNLHFHQELYAEIGLSFRNCDCFSRRKSQFSKELSLTDFSVFYHLGMRAFLGKFFGFLGVLFSLCKWAKGFFIPENVGRGTLLLLFYFRFHSVRFLIKIKCFASKFVCFVILRQDSGGCFERHQKCPLLLMARLARYLFLFFPNLGTYTQVCIREIPTR